MQQTSSIVTKNRIYLLGAYGLTSVYTAIINGGLNDYSSYYDEDTTNYMMPGSGQPWRQQYQINTTQSGDISGWITSGTLPTLLGGYSAIVTKNRVYLFGGHNETTSVSTVYTATINTDGTLGTWTTGTALPAPLSRSQAIVTKNRVYLLGGNNADYTSIVYTAPINADGTLGAWTTEPSLPGPMSWTQAIVTKNKVYVLGGTPAYGVTSSVIYTAPINSDGTLGTWSTYSLSLPVSIYSTQAIVTKNRVYLIGGLTGNGSVQLNTIYTATISSDGVLGAWSLSGTLPNNLSGTHAVIMKNRVYLLGGIGTGGVITSSIYTAYINADGALGTWSLSPNSLPGVLTGSQAIVTKNRIYLIGGNNATTYVNTIYTASILEGLNDYSAYYDGTITPTTVIDDSTVFALPDLSTTEKFDTVSYIKY